MRYLLIVFLFVPVFLKAQQSNEPFKKANTIIIQTSDEPTDALKKFAHLLQKNGYSIRQSDAGLGLLTTEQKIEDFSGITISVSVEEKDITTMQITGIYESLMNKYRPPMRAELKGSLSPLTSAFEELEKVAKQYSPGQMLYTRTD